MNDALTDVLRIKRIEKGKEVYVRHAQDVADFHGVHVNAVYASRRKEDGSDKLDKLMAYDEASKVANCNEGVGLTIRGSKESLLSSLDKMMDDGSSYLVIFTKEKSGE